MLQLQTKMLDIGRISKILVKYNIKASITNQVITLDSEVSDELITKLCNEINICSIQNFKSDNVQEETTIVESEKNLEQETVDTSDKEEKTWLHTNFSQPLEKYDLIYSQVKRGEVYLCDYGEAYGCEQGGIRYAIIVQNEAGNLYSPTTIALACTTEEKKNLPVHYDFTFSDQNMLDYDSVRVGLEKNVVMAEQIRTVDKSRLRKFLGTMTPEFMEKMQEIIDISLQLRREEKTIVKQEKIYIDKPPIYANTQREYKDVNLSQIEFLSVVEVKELLKISKSSDSDKIKAEKILKLFGFDLQKNGVQYLLKAILVSPKNSQFNLEILTESVSKSENGVEQSEVKRLIVARVKEQFKLKKAHTIDFIRLVNRFLIKEEEHEEINI